jgi:hypothetical protein
MQVNQDPVAGSDRKAGVSSFSTLGILKLLISTTPSKPLMSFVDPAKWKIFYFSAVNYDPGTTELISIRVNLTRAR